MKLSDEIIATRHALVLGQTYTEGSPPNLANFLAIYSRLMVSSGNNFNVFTDKMLLLVIKIHVAHIYCTSKTRFAAYEYMNGAIRGQDEDIPEMLNRLVVFRDLPVESAMNISLISPR